MFTNQMRMTGFSGIDVADMVNQMMRAESMRLHRLQGQRQIFQWQQEQVRGVANSLQDFRRAHFSFMDTPQSQSIRHASNFTGNSASINGGGASANGINITTTSGARAGDHTLRVNQLATAHRFASQPQRPGTTSSGNANVNAFLNADGTLTNANMQVTINGQQRNITIDYNDLTQAQRDELTAFGAFRNEILEMHRVEGATRAMMEADWNTSTGFNNARNALVNEAIGNISGNALQTSDNALVVAAREELIAERRDAHYAEHGNLNDWDDDNVTLTNNDILARVRTNFANDSNNADAIAERFTEDFTLTTAQRNWVLNDDANGHGTSLNEQLTQLGQGFGMNDAIANSIQNQINTQFGAGRATVTNDGGRLNIVSNGTNQVTVGGNPIGFTSGSSGTINLAMTVGEFMGLNDGETTTLNLSQRGRDVEIEIEANMTLNQLMNRINTSGLDVRMTFSQSSGEFILESTLTGAVNEISFSGDFFDELGMTQQVAAQDTEIVFNNNTITQESNNFSLDGMNINLSQGVAIGETINIRLSTDVAATRELVTNFVDRYNALVRELQDLTNTARPRDNRNQLFQPLTDEQRRGMSESEIRDWERNAQTGLLNRDNEIRQILNDMRAEMGARVTLENGSTFSLANMGIRLSTNLSDGGILTINQDELNAALENNIEGVTALFTGEGAVSVSGGRPQTNTNGTPILGLGARLDGALNRYISSSGATGSLISRAGREGGSNQDRFSRQMQEQDRRIDTMMRWLERRENQLFAQFSRMEQAMMQGQQQMTFWDQIMFGAM